MSDEHANHGAEGGDKHEGGHSGGHGGHGGGGHGGGGHAEGEHEGAPEWLISFADNVALMMGFFVILLAMNMGPKASAVQGGDPAEVANYEATGRQLDFVIAIREAFNTPPDERNPGDAALVRRMKERKAVGETTRPGPDGDKHNQQAPRPTNWTQPTGFVLFGDNESGLTEEARNTLHQAAEQLRGSRWVVQVRGHVSGLEARGDKARAMRLSFERALAAAQELVNAGMTWEQLRVVGCADSDAATPAAGPGDKRRNNQRAEVVTTPESVPADQWNERKK